MKMMQRLTSTKFIQRMRRTSCFDSEEDSEEKTKYGDERGISDPC